MKNIVVVHRFESKLAAKKSLELANWLKKKKYNVMSHPDQTLSSRYKKVRPQNIKLVDLVVVVGGDGTYLEAVRMLSGHKAPILGVNMGSLGFLTVVRKEDIYEAVTLALEEKLEKRPRAMIEIVVKRGSKTLIKATALNDIVIERGPYSQLINIAIEGDGRQVGEVKADGLLVATPTGSTAYNLAAGGPILHPYVETFVVTPICPHSLTHRPIIFPDNIKLSFKILNKKQRAFLTIDGQKGGELQFGDKIAVQRAKCDHYILRLPSHNYFELLREKLKFGERS